MKIREAREIALEKSQCDIEIGKAEVRVLSKKRDKMILEASTSRTEQWKLKNLMDRLGGISNRIRKDTVRQKRLRARTRMDDQEIKNAFELKKVRFDWGGTWKVTIDYRDESHMFNCYYSDLFMESKHIWSARGRGASLQTKSHHIPDYLIEHVWRELVDPWSFLTALTCVDIYDRLYGHALEHRYFSSAIRCLRGRRWIYGIGRIGNKIRIVTGQSGKGKIYCMELHDTMGLAFYPSPQGGDDMIFCGAAAEKRLRLPIVGFGGQPWLFRKRGGKNGKTKRDCSPHEKIAWNWLKDCQETTIMRENQLPIEKLRDCYRKGQLWQPE